MANRDIDIVSKAMDIANNGMALICALIFLGCVGIGMPADSEGAEDARYEPRYYEADFDTVWNAAIAAFHVEKFIVRLMNKETGYITADWLGSSTKDHVGIWISKEYGLIKVSINRSREYLEYDEKN